MGFRLTPLVLFAAAAVICVVAYALMRQPEVRHMWLSLIPYRESTQFAHVRRILAPRCILVAGALTALCAFALCLPVRSRIWLTTAMQARGAWRLALVLGLFCSATATVLDLHLSYYRVFGKPVCAIENEEVLGYVLPQAWHDSRQLRRELPRDARVALKTDSEILLYQLPALSYPIAFYEIVPAKPAMWQDDPGFVAFAHKKRLTHLLLYTMNSSERLNLVPLK